MEDRFEQVIAVKRASHRSWSNLYAAAGEMMGLSTEFGTEKVETSSRSYLKTAMEESGLGAAEIRTEIEKRGLI